MEADGVSIIVQVLGQTFSENLLDSDQNDEVRVWVRIVPHNKFLNNSNPKHNPNPNPYP
jgi:hypothetical protein